MKKIAMGPERMTHDELFLEIKRALYPPAADVAPLRKCDLASRYVSAREQAATVSILGDAENYINIDGVLWSLITLEDASGRHVSRNTSGSAHCAAFRLSFLPM